MKKRITFAAWMAVVNALIEAKCGMSASDLPDVPYREWYDDGKTTISAASKAVKSAGGDF